MIRLSIWLTKKTSLGNDPPNTSIVYFFFWSKSCGTRGDMSKNTHMWLKSPCCQDTSKCVWFIHATLVVQGASELTCSVWWPLRDFSKLCQPVIQKCLEQWDGLSDPSSYEHNPENHITMWYNCHSGVQLFLHINTWISSLSLTRSCTKHWWSHGTSPCPVPPHAVVGCDGTLSLGSMGSRWGARILLFTAAMISVWTILMSAQVCIKQPK